MDQGFRDMMDLEDHPNKKEQYCRDLKVFNKNVKSFPVEERVERRMLQSIWGKSFGKKKQKDIPPPSVPFEELKRTRQCRWCWLCGEVCSDVDYCTCELTTKSTKTMSFNVALLLHYSEFRRASNTGKVIAASLPKDTCHTFLFGNTSHMNDLQTLIDRSPHTYLLFPSEESIGASSFVEAIERYEEEKISTEEPELVVGNLEAKVNLIILDGTWREARRMRHCSLLEHLPIIQLSPDSVNGYKSRFIARQKSDIAERISSLEATALLIKEVGEVRKEKRGKNATEEVAELINSEILLSNLEIVMRQLMLQSGMTGKKSNVKRM